MIKTELKKLEFINQVNGIKSFSIRAAALTKCRDKYLMVRNEGEVLFKHPGGHININESVVEGLQRELLEEIGLKYNKDFSKEFFCDLVFINGNCMITFFYHLKLSKEELNRLFKTTPLPSKLFTRSELNDINTWESEIRAIDYFEKK